MKKQHKNKKQTTDRSNQINERLGTDVLEKLKLASKQLKDVEIREKAEADKQAKQERINKEKNKSFEELFDESNLDWKSFK